MRPRPDRLSWPPPPLSPCCHHAACTCTDLCLSVSLSLLSVDISVFVSSFSHRLACCPPCLHPPTGVTELPSDSDLGSLRAPPDTSSGTSISSSGTTGAAAASASAASVINGASSSASAPTRHFAWGTGPGALEVPDCGGATAGVVVGGGSTISNGTVTPATSVASSSSSAAAAAASVSTTVAVTAPGAAAGSSGDTQTHRKTSDATAVGVTTKPFSKPGTRSVMVRCRCLCLRLLLAAVILFAVCG